MTATTSPRLLTRAQVADRLACSERLVDRLRHEGVLDAVKLGASIRITEASLARYIASLPAA